MTPDEGLEDAQKQEEAWLLASLRGGMSPEQLDAVAAKAARLKEISRPLIVPGAGYYSLPGPEGLIPAEPQHLPRDGTTVDGYDNTVLLTRELPTAGIIYADVALDLRGALDPEDLPLVPLFGRMMQETGIKGKLDPTQLQRQLGAKTGGVSGSVLCTLKVPRVTPGKARMLSCTGKQYKGQGDA